MNEHESSHNKEKQMYWDEQTPLFEKIKQFGGISNYMKGIEVKDIFTPNNRNLCCIDERVTAGTIHYAGCGILDQENALSEKMIKRLKEAGTDGVWSHKGCGAASMAFSKLSDEEKTKFGDVETYAQEWAKKMANALDVPYLGHLEVQPNFHNARVIYYDGTGRFDPSRSEKLPLGFVISRAYLEKEYAKYILRVALSIAFGDHGFGHKQFVASGSPLQIILVGSSENSGVSLEKLRAETEEIAKKYPKTVAVDGFNAPTL